MPKRIVYNRGAGYSTGQAVQDKKDSWWVRFRIHGHWSRWAPYANLGKPSSLHEPGTILTVTLPNDKD